MSSSALGDFTFFLGEEVALYCAKYLPDIIKDQKAYKEGKLQKVCLPTLFILYFYRLSLFSIPWLFLFHCHLPSFFLLYFFLKNSVLSIMLRPFLELPY